MQLPLSSVMEQLQCKSVWCFRIWIICILHVSLNFLKVFKIKLKKKRKIFCTASWGSLRSCITSKRPYHSILRPQGILLWSVSHISINKYWYELQTCRWKEMFIFCHFLMPILLYSNCNGAHWSLSTDFGFVVYVH